MMAMFIDLHQRQQLVLINVEAVQSVLPSRGGQPGAEVFFTDGTQIDVDESVDEVEKLV